MGLGLYNTIVVFFALSVIEKNKSEVGGCTFRESSFLFFILSHVLMEVSSWGKESAPVGASSSFWEWTLF